MSANHHEEPIENTSSALGFILPLLLFALLAAGAYYLLGTGPSHSAEESTYAVTDSMSHEGMELATTESTGKVDTSGNYIYELGKMVTIDLPNGAGSLTVGEYSTENKLYQFLSDTKTTIDTVKGNWFEFTNVRFLTGGSKVDSISSAQLKNIVAISKGFTDASFKVGGYTDNTGDSAVNVTLSQRRSDAVVAELKKLGAASTSITGTKGYGPAFPIGDNATAEGRAMNRRVAINVKSK